MKVIVVGGGKVGFYLASTLKEHGHTPVVIEKRRDRCQFIADQLDLPIICGDGSSIDALEDAGARDAEAVMGVTGRDEDNLIICQLAKLHFHAKRTVARVNNPKNTAAMKQLGVDIPVSSTDALARILEREIETAAIRQLLRFNRGESSLVEYQLPDNYAQSGITLKDIPLPEESIVVTITRDGNMIIPRGNATLLSGDRIMVACKDTVVHELGEILGLS